MSSSVLDRFVLINGHPTLPPGRCIGCGTTGATKYIDTQLQIQFFGRVYICVACWVSTAMRSCDMVPQFNVETIKADFDVCRTLLTQAIARIKELESALASVESLRSTIDSIGTVDYSTAPKQESSTDQPEVLEGHSGDSQQPELPFDAPESGSPEPNTEQRSSNVRDYDSPDELSGLLKSI